MADSAAEIFMSRVRILVPLLLAIVLLAPLMSLGTGTLAQDDKTPTEQTSTKPALLGGDLPGDPQIQLVEVVSGLQTPVNVAFPPDDSGRMFVVEVGGAIRIVNPDGSLIPEPFLDLSSTVALRPGQQGLLGLAFHPNFAENGRFFVSGPMATSISPPATGAGRATPSTTHKAGSPCLARFFASTSTVVARVNPTVSPPIIRSLA
jgi:glucose/arabinose dehydrogenase